LCHYIKNLAAASLLSFFFFFYLFLFLFHLHQPHHQSLESVTSIQCFLHPHLPSTAYKQPSTASFLSFISPLAPLTTILTWTRSSSSNLFTMLPPTDSLQHQNLKLAEFISSTQITQPAPPAYFATNHRAAALHHEQLAADDDDDDDDDDAGYDFISSRPAPITIKIDASLKIEGHANTIVLPSACPPSSTTPQPSPQNGRVDRLTNMVLTALKDAGLLNSTQETNSPAGSRRPLEVHVNAAIVLKGNKNTVCSGLPRLVKPPPPAAGAAVGVEMAKVKPPAERGGHSMGAESQKRRACSVRAISKLTIQPPLSLDSSQRLTSVKIAGAS
jgi:hypothetical protein